MSPIERFRRVAAGLQLLRRLPPADRRILGHAWRELLVYRLRVHVRRGFPARDRLFDRTAPSPFAASVDHLVALFNQAAQTSVHGTYCLPRSLALRRFLRRYGTETRLCLGTKTTKSGRTGHAWIEHEGQIIGDSEDLVRQFVPFHETA